MRTDSYDYNLEDADQRGYVLLEGALIHRRGFVDETPYYWGVSMGLCGEDCHDFLFTKAGLLILHELLH